MEAEALRAQGHPQLHRKFDTRLGCMRSALKKIKIKIIPEEHETKIICGFPKNLFWFWCRTHACRAKSAGHCVNFFFFQSDLPLIRLTGLVELFHFLSSILPPPTASLAFLDTWNLTLHLSYKFVSLDQAAPFQTLIFILSSCVEVSYIIFYVRNHISLLLLSCHKVGS